MIPMDSAIVPSSSNKRQSSPMPNNEVTERNKTKPGLARKKNWKPVVISIVVIVLLIGGGIGGYVWYNWDSDGDGVRDAEDDFPNDPAASIDTDGDGWPDEWNKGKSKSDSISTPKLLLDAFPNDSKEWKDTDEDGYGDNKADMFPGNSD